MMALIICPECKNPFSEHGSNCPKCGCPLEIAKKEYEAHIEFLLKRKEAQKLKYEAEALELVQKSELKRVKAEKEKEKLIEKSSAKISELELKAEKERVQAEKEKEAEISALMEERSVLEKSIAEYKAKKQQLELDISSTGFLQFSKKRALKEELVILENLIVTTKQKCEFIPNKIDSIQQLPLIIPSREEIEKIRNQQDKQLKKTVTVLTKELALQKVMEPLVRDSGMLSGYAFNHTIKSEIYSILDELGVATVPQMVEFSYILESADKNVICGTVEACIKYNKHIKKAPISGDFEQYYTKVSDEEAQHLRNEALKERQEKLDEEVKKSQQKLLEIEKNLIKLQKPQYKERHASVIGRGVAGAAIAGPAGAIVGALSAIDKNNRNNEK